MGIQSKKASAFRKPSSKQKGNLLNGERYLQITYPKRGQISEQTLYQRRYTAGK